MNKPDDPQENQKPVTASVHPLVMRASKLLESYPNEPCENCDVSVGHICEECHLLQMICNLKNELQRVYQCASHCCAAAERVLLGQYRMTTQGKDTELAAKDRYDVAAAILEIQQERPKSA